VSIGETLARARRHAGLSIADVSSQTRIMQSVIDGIEHDDYSACGGDFYARGNIRLIARVLHVNSTRLVEAYDAARRPAEWIAAAMPTEPIMAASAPEEPASEEHRPLTASDDTQPIPMGTLSESITVGEPPHPVTPGQPPHHPNLPAGRATAADESGPEWPAADDRHHSIWLEIGATLLAVAGLGGILLAFGTSDQAARRAPVAGRHLAGGHGQTRPAQAPRGLTQSASPESSRPARALVPASIAAFGPGGTGQGDNQHLAQQALAGRAAAPWHSDWYATPRFGHLQPGTGLLLDMGRTVTITSARVSLVNSAGVHLALRIGNSPTLASLKPAARAQGSGGVVRLITAPTRGRYVLVWFTRLPPYQVGTFQVSVYDIRLRGHPAN
jgi:transcriptional regulator with XRE-family HTH domain